MPTLQKLVKKFSLFLAHLMEKSNSQTKHPLTHLIRRQLVVVSVYVCVSVCVFVCVAHVVEIIMLIFLYNKTSVLHYNTHH